MNILTLILIIYWVTNLFLAYVYYKTPLEYWGTEEPNWLAKVLTFPALLVYWYKRSKK